MSVFEFDTGGQLSVKDEAVRNPAGPEYPGFLDNAGYGTGLGVMRGGARVGQFIGMAAAAPVVAFEKFFADEGDTDASDAVFRSVDEYINSAVDYWTPWPNELGVAGRVLGGLSEITLPLMAGGGNPALLVGTQSLGTSTDLAREGVDPKAAVTVGAVQGAATAVGFKIPFLGRTLTSKIASGAGGNLGVNTATAAVSQEILEATGDEEQAKAFDPFDAEARTVDLLTGVVFGALAHGARPAELDAALTAQNAHHYQEGTAPGIPADVAASVAHQDAIEGAIQSLLKGEPVSPPKAVTEAEFLQRPAEAVEPPEGYRDLDQTDELPGLADTDAALEGRLRQRIAEDPEGAIAEYASLPDSEGGRILNTDLARELSPEYRADRTRSSAVHEPASELVKTMYARKLKEAPADGQAPLVVFTAGGTGAGKSTGIASLSEAVDTVRQAQIVYDTNLNTLSSSVQKINQALEAQKNVSIFYVLRDPVDALTNGALPRAMRMGRTVPLSEHARTHVGSTEVIRELAVRYKDDPRVDIQVIDNTRGKGNARMGSVDDVPKLEYDSVLGKLHEALETAQAQGRISEAVYQGTRGAGLPVGESLPGRKPQDGSGHGGRSQQADDAGSLTLSAAREALLASDITLPTGAFDADGNPVAASARDLVAQADAEVQQAQHDAKAFDAAASCFLSKGGE